MEQAKTLEILGDREAWGDLQGRKWRDALQPRISETLG